MEENTQQKTTTDLAFIMRDTVEYIHTHHKPIIKQHAKHCVNSTPESSREEKIISASSSSIYKTTPSLRDLSRSKCENTSP